MTTKHKILIDTNILIYFFNTDSEFYKFSRNVLSDNFGNIYIAQKSISEWVSVLSKIKRYDIIEAELENILSSFKILYANNLSVKIFYELIKKYRPSGNRVYDFDIISGMLANKIRKIITINIDDFKKIDEIEIISEKDSHML